MRDFVIQLLDLQTLRFGAEGVRFGLERPIPAWAWALIGLLAVGLGVWSYSRLQGAAWWRAFLGLTRAGLLLSIVLLLLGPRLVLRTERVERDWVVVMLDRSASLGIEDASGPGGERSARESQLRDALARSEAEWRELAREREVVWLGFDGGAFDIKGDAGESSAGGFSPLGALGPPTGQQTRLGTSLEQALARAAARPVSAIVVLSDGRTRDEPDRAALRRLQSDLIPVHAVALGSADPVGDLAIRRVDAPRAAFSRDLTPVRVSLERTGLGPVGGTVRLVDTATGLALAEQRVGGQRGGADEAGGATFDVTLTVEGSEEAPTGRRQWRVELVPDGADLIASNNSAALEIDLVDRPMRVLYVDGYPRWEQRYLRNLLIREKSISCSTVLLAPDRAYIQEGDIEIAALPDSPERWAEYDAVMLGDVRPEMFADEQLAQLRQHVATRGGGLIIIAGPGAMPAQWWETPLADLLPFTKGATDGGAVGEPLLMRPTPGAERLGVLRLGGPGEPAWPESLTSPEAGWSALRWAQRLDRAGLKPTAEVLAEGVEYEAGDDAWPVLLSMRYGAGRVLYAASDETWRWRYARGEALPERYWIQLIRLLGREAIGRSGQSAVIEASPRRALVDEPVRVKVELLDQTLVDEKLPSVVVRLARRAAPGEGEGAASRAELTLRPEGTDGRSYTGVWPAAEAGEWAIETAEPALAGYDLRAAVTVGLADDELREPAADHAVLQRLAEATGGRVFAPEEIGTLFKDPALLPKRRVTLINEQSESLWDTPLALIVVITLLTIEWVGRRLIRLV